MQSRPRRDRGAWCAASTPADLKANQLIADNIKARLAGRLRRGRRRRRRHPGRRAAGRAAWASSPGDTHHPDRAAGHEQTVARHRAGAEGLHRRRHLRGRHERVRPGLHLHAAAARPSCSSAAATASTSSRSSSPTPTRRPPIKPALAEAAGAGAVVTDWTEKNAGLLQRPAGRAQRDGADPGAAGADRLAEHHLGAGHAGEEQGPRHRHPAHHGRAAVARSCGSSSCAARSSARSARSAAC